MTERRSRIESDSLGAVELPIDALWGAQSQRSLQYFAIGKDQFPSILIQALTVVKKAAAISNEKLGLLAPEKSRLIQTVCDEILSGKYADQFPLSVWQTGSGTQTNMNINEVIANRCSQLAGHELGSKEPVHPNDHVNMSQSSNDVFPTAMHLAGDKCLTDSLLPSLQVMHAELKHKTRQFNEIAKVGRTHMMDATPLTSGQEFSAFAQQLEFSIQQISHSQQALRQIALGGTAVGTGLNTVVRWAELVADEISRLTGVSYQSADNKFSQLASHDAITAVHGQLSLLASTLFKMANDIRLMNSGPRCGLAEITIPENEPGSSIMPGKVNPTQVEALTMVCLRVMSNYYAVNMANSQGQFQLNTYKPLIIYVLLESIELLADAVSSFTRYCLQDLQVNQAQLATTLERSLMLVTALSPVIGYDLAAKAVKHAVAHNQSLKQAVVSLELMSEAEYELAIDIEKMLGPAIPKNSGQANQ